SRLPLSALEEGIAFAQAAPPPRVLVTVFLEGGADALSILFPGSNSRYRALRPTLALPASAGQPFAEDDRLRWHPSAAGLAELHAEGKVTAIPAIGYTDPNQSHFTSRHFWEVGATSASIRTGWIGRYLDLVGTQDNPLQGLSLDWNLQPSLATASVPVATVDSPGAYEFWARGVWGDVETEMLDSIGDLSAAAALPDPALKQASAVAYQTAQLRTQLSAFAAAQGDTPTSPVTYPAGEDFAERLAGLAAMLGAGLPLHCVALQAPGMYDTHSEQAGELTNGLKLTSDSLLAFQRDLEARSLADRVVTLVWSEFGRRARENGSRGTDHGAAGIGFLIGSRVRGQMIGEFPGLGSSGIDSEGNMRATADYRGLYSGLLEQWLGTDAAAVIPGAAQFARPTLLK
ncbi:MAG: DUF1501 domain-containing protein, partial [Actinomycetota bacterium]|nr:DUF1501 domain-containing protein [Actinomycetota bacterium]